MECRLVDKCRNSLGADVLRQVHCPIEFLKDENLNKFILLMTDAIQICPYSKFILNWISLTQDTVTSFRLGGFFRDLWFRGAELCIWSSVGPRRDRSIQASYDIFQAATLHAPRLTSLKLTLMHWASTMEFCVPNLSELKELEISVYCDEVIDDCVAKLIQVSPSLTKFCFR